MKIDIVDIGICVNALFNLYLSFHNMSSLRPSLHTSDTIHRTYKPAILAPQKTPVATKTVTETKVSTKPAVAMDTKGTKRTSRV